MSGSDNNHPPDEGAVGPNLGELIPLLDERDGAAKLAFLLRDSDPTEFWIPRVVNVWEQVGLRYLNDKIKSRPFEALRIFFQLYDKMIQCQREANMRLHKGTPLLWIAECYAKLGYRTLGERYLMLALSEDAISGTGKVDPEHTGVYFRLVWRLGMKDEILKEYATRCFQISEENAEDSRFPEWVLQHLDQDWMTAFPRPDEANVYVVNGHYVNHLLARLGGGDGRALEQLAEYLMVSMPGCRTSRRKRSKSTDYDVICSVDGFEVDFRSELGRYFVCECKDWEMPADFSSMAKFCRVLDSVKSRFGVLFSKAGISGEGKTTGAEREQLKVFQDRGMVIVVIDEDDLKRVAEGSNFINLLRRKYETVRLDLAGAEG
jgi:hypothetical protein